MGNGIDTRRMIGQRLISGFPGPAMSEDFIRLVKERKVGNAILFKHNIESVAQLRSLCESIQSLVLAETGYPAFIAIDQEGGAVTRLSPDATNVPGAMALAATDRKDYARDCARITGRELLALGVNFNLAPVLDVNSNPDNPVIGVRSYGEDPDTVIEYGRAAAEGYAEAGILCAAKHFPGHGDTNLDSHLSLPEVRKSRAELDALELRPFAAAVRAGIPAVMTSHILFPALEQKRVPATMSRAIVTGVLRGELGFRGLVLSDCMEMNAIKEYYGTVEGAVAAMAAGVDLVFISHTASAAAAAAEAAERAVASGRIDPRELSESAERIVGFKDRYLNKPRPDISIVSCAEHRELAARVLSQSITAVNIPAAGQPDLGTDPLFIGCNPFLTTRASNDVDKSLSFARFMEERFGGTGAETSIDPGTEEIAALVPRARGKSCVVVGTYNGHVKRGQLALVRALAESGAPLVVVALRNPYDLAGLPSSVCAIAAYEYSAQSLRAAADVLAKTAAATGTPPVALGSAGSN